MATKNVGKFFADHALTVFKAHETSAEDPETAWVILNTELPYIDEICGYDTFRKCLPVVIAMQERYRMIQKENQKLQEQIANLRGKGEARNIGGWTLRRHKAGYYMLQKSIKGKVQTIYIGKEVDEDEARRKISEKTEKLRQAGIID